MQPHEALYLMETGRLEVRLNDVVMSIEQAYTIFLDPRNDLSFEEYLVYSYLSRAGYIVYQNDPEAEINKINAAKSKSLAKKEDEMIWCVLMEKLNLPVPKMFINQEKQLYEETKMRMNLHCEQIQGARQEAGESTDSNSKIIKAHSRSKRELSPQESPDEPASKSLKSNSAESQEHNFLDVLKTEVEYIAHQEIFEKFQFVKRANTFNSPSRKFSLKFDIFLPKTNFKRTEDLPTYRLIITR